MAVGVGAFLTKKKLRCTRCGEWNDVGNAKQYTAPSSSKYRKLEQRSVSVAATPAVAPTAAPANHGANREMWSCAAGHENHPSRTECGVCGKRPHNAADRATDTVASTLMTDLERLAKLRTQGLLSEEEFGAAKAKLLGL